MELRSRSLHARRPLREDEPAESSASVANGSLGDDDERAKEAREAAEPRLDLRHWLLIAILPLCLGVLVRRLDYQFPAVTPASNLANFSEARARPWLEKLTADGPRASGSHANEVLARKKILDEIAAISAAALPIHRIDVDEQRPSDCFDLSFLHDFTLCYRKVLNIVVRIGRGGAKPSDHSLLYSCHFDSVPNSPGATDDGVSCAIMIDMIRVISLQPEPLPYDLILLFNGAEENFLQAAHGFITQHPWRHSIRAFVNLEGSGAGGRELLFQAGPGHAWLIKTYMDSAPHPHCSVMAQEVFQTGLIPSDTDYRIFRDYGRVPGLDIAYTRNGYVYHTEFDEPGRIQAGAIQRAGENTLALARGILASPYFLNPASYHEGSWVFFDVAGLFNLYYPVAAGVFVNLVVCGAVAVKLVLKFRAYRPRMGLSGPERGYHPLTFLAALGCHIGVTAVMGLVSLCCSRLVHLAGLTMSWYAQHGVVLPLYFFPPLLCGLAMHAFLARRLFARRDPYTMEGVFWDATCLVYALITFLMTAYGLASAFLALIHVLFPLARPLWSQLIPAAQPRRRLFASLASLIPVAFMGIYALLICFEFFLPMLGRSGTSGDPEYVVAFLCLVGPISLCLYLGGLVHLSSRSVVKAFCWGLGLCLCIAALMATTNLGEPYAFHWSGPRLRRAAILHVHRDYVGRDGALEKTETAIWMSSFDFRGTSDFPAEILRGASPPNCSLARNEFCDLPYYVLGKAGMGSTERKLRRSRWKPTKTGPEIPAAQRVQIKKISERSLGDGRLEVGFSVAGPDHITLYLTPGKGLRLTQWSLSEGPFPKPQANSQVAFLAYAVDGLPPWEISAVFEGHQTANAPVAAVAAAGHFIHGAAHKSPELRSLEAEILRRRSQPRSSFRWRMTPFSWNVHYVSALL